MGSGGGGSGGDSSPRTRIIHQQADESNNAAAAAVVSSTSAPSSPLREKIRLRLSLRDRPLYRDALAEFFGTAFLLFSGCCVNAQYILTRTRYNDWLAVALGWGLCLTSALYLSARTSGGHLNPAVSFFFWTQGKLDARRLGAYTAAQFVGSFVGALLAFCVYFDAIAAFDGGTRYVTGAKATAGIFATYPGPHLSWFGAVVDQIAATAVLCMCAAAVADRRTGIPGAAQPIVMGLVLTMIGLTLGLNSGYAINPTRDLAPRIFTLLAGYGWRVFSIRNWTWWFIPAFLPFVGATLGAWLYDFFIGFHLDQEGDLLDESNDLLDLPITTTIPEQQPPQQHVIQIRSHRHN